MTADGLGKSLEILSMLKDREEHIRKLRERIEHELGLPEASVEQLETRLIFILTFSYYTQSFQSYSLKE